MEDLAEVARLWQHAGLPSSSLARLSLMGSPHYLPSAFRASSAATISIALSALAASEIYRLRTGHAHPVCLDRRDACIEFKSQDLFRPRTDQPPPETWDPLSGLYPTAGGGFIRLHANFPHHKAGLLHILNLPPSAARADIALALRHRDALEFEADATARGMCASACRTPDAWAAHPAGQHIQDTATRMQHVPFHIHAAPSTAHEDGISWTRTTSSPRNCLSGVRVLDLTRVLAGPIAGRTLASHGADVLWVTGPHLPSLPTVDGDTSRGKRTIQLDLRAAADVATIKQLVTSADVFIDAYRPGALDAFGLDAASLHALNPSLVVARVSAYGRTGPWANKRGFDSLVQAASGFNVTEAQHAGDATPKAMPVQALDHASGYFLAFAIMAALHRRDVTASTQNVAEVSLVWTAEWLRHLGTNKSHEAKLFSDEELIQASYQVEVGDHKASYAKRSPDMEPRPKFDYYPQGLCEGAPVWLPRV
ncbi:Aste57867_17650 [Aphanomyces stellatus]|uniref:Aste57867_17650 protein n=1 Tax=Aphanomyces stellatus TaxID=120398 RepID=A0A485LA16_9STRA|nr:hypothetical protein As57867_017589 [Aphanomyces stellatus]VFT94401.1 Aste57867_17650 [Aphanomyces stellatus]